MLVLAHVPFLLEVCEIRCPSPPSQFNKINAPARAVATQKNRLRVFSGTGTPAYALTTSRSNFEVESIHRCHPAIQAGFLQPPSPQKKTPPSCIWRRVQIPRLVYLLPSQPPPARAHKSP